ncbi:MAG: phosphoribosylformylglycinamidine synthase subunit PurS [Elainellaceae cyanobacterium]
MKQYQAQIYITLRPSVLDPAGTAVRSGLHQLGFEQVEDVRIGRYIELSVAADSPQTAEQQIDKMCDQLLTNPVIENYRIEIS